MQHLSSSKGDYREETRNCHCCRCSTVRSGSRGRYGSRYAKAPPAPVIAVYDWAGFYIGANGGWGESHSAILESLNNLTPADVGFGRTEAILAVGQRTTRAHRASHRRSTAASSTKSSWRASWRSGGVRYSRHTLSWPSRSASGLMEGAVMPLTRGEAIGYDSDLMVFSSR
jgi:hypothetical protein